MPFPKNTIDHLVESIAEAHKRKLIAEYFVMRTVLDVQVEILFNAQTDIQTKKKLYEHINETYAPSNMYFSAFAEMLCVEFIDNYYEVDEHDRADNTDEE